MLYLGFFFGQLCSKEVITAQHDDGVTSFMGAPTLADALFMRLALLGY
jgi:hypothetical protein